MRGLTSITFAHAGEPVSRPGMTLRQQIMRLITDQVRSSRELAALVDIPERDVEAHLVHIARSAARDRRYRFKLEPAECHDCGFVFRTRTRLTTPSRCPSCRSEHISAPRYRLVSP